MNVVFWGCLKELAKTQSLWEARSSFNVKQADTVRAAK